MFKNTNKRFIKTKLLSYLKMNKKQIIGKVYKNARKTLTINRKKYHLYCAVFRTEKHFRNLIPFFKDESKEIKVILDNKSDVCLGYGTKKILKLLKDKNRFI